MIKFKISFVLLLSYFFISVQLPAQQLMTQWSQEIKKVNECEYDLVFNVKIDAGWHMYSMKKAGEDGPNPTKITFKKSSEYELVGPTKESKPIEEMDKVFEMKVLYFVGKASFTQRVKLKSASKIKITGSYEYQVCTDEQCKFPPAESFTFDMPQGSESCMGKQQSENKSATTLTTTTVDTTKKFSTTPSTPNIPDVKTPVTDQKSATEIKPAKATEDCNAWQKFFLGLAAGFGAMLMPCIYSLIPLTVSFFLKRAKSRAAAIRDSMFYGISIIVSFVVPTMLITIIFGPSALSNIATNTYLNLFFFLLFVIFALSFFGLFEITLPASWANKLDAKADKGGLMGIFFMALTLVVVSFSCTAGFLGPLLSTLASGESYLCPFAGFTGFGLGIALPFMLFAFFPSMLKSLPKSGGWMTTFKVTIAFIELALAVKFLANADNVNEWGWITREVFISLWVAIFGGLTLYLFGVFRTSHDDPPSHLSVGRILWATFFASFTIYMIPGLWGAPLKIISSFPPPHNYAESPHGVGYHGSNVATSSANVVVNGEAAALENTMVVGPSPDIKLFKDDYEGALKYAKLVNKPLFIDFTGKACVNCRLMESTVWISNEVLPMLKDSVVIVSLYVDSKIDLPKQEQKEVFWYGKNRTLSTIGDKWAFMQTTKYNASSQPQYVLVNHDESNASEGTIETEKDPKKFASWLRAGIRKFYSK
ncbi:MAG: protein-disulfide reductase DsbD domain-containing protein [Bacteroidota bacterium]|jgi:thiol:disulfide interchange protein